MIEVSERTSSGCSAASIWAIMPPIEAPTTWAGAMSELAEQAGGVLRHVRERVLLRPGSRRAQHLLGDRRRAEVEVGGAADVAVVEADDVEATLGELCAEVLVPGDHLRRQAHDQQDRGVVGVAEGLVAEGHAPPDVAELLGHPTIVENAPSASAQQTVLQCRVNELLTSAVELDSLANCRVRCCLPHTCRCRPDPIPEGEPPPAGAPPCSR